MSLKLKFAAVLAGLAVCGLAAAQAYPTKPIKLLVGFAPGGATDQLGRTYARKLSEKLGQQVVVDNKPGAGGNLAIQLLTQSPADGYTLAVGANYIASNAALKRNPYNWDTDLAPVAQLAATPNLLVVPANSKIRNIKDLIAAGKVPGASPTFGSAGMGTSIHLAGELFKLMTGTNMTHVPYKGVSPAEVDLMAGTVDLMFGSISTAVPLVKSGRLHAIAVTSRERVKELPNIPTVEELGLKGFEVEASYLLAAPAKIPADVLKRLADAMAEINKDPEVIAFIERLYARPLKGGPEETKAFLKSEVDKWQRVVNASGLKVE
ncbi:Bug family tripartite tricarboxylate transporter substrate binding protein [Lacisediminimonas profundi]|uniref:Bug family tripartite tricarboxylate transporter substrate binding protein n=1 Tax=Lacisediminimonas profundi TaxID=2603856 RepID=UPI00124B67EB|nr:tripartite tricarboxylate transporter substrate binding protein [Lacisediminimonas profundi]